MCNLTAAEVLSSRLDSLHLQNWLSLTRAKMGFAKWSVVLAVVNQMCCLVSTPTNASCPVKKEGPEWASRYKTNIAIS